MATTEKKKILLVDDDVSLVVTLSDFLRFEGYDVVSAHSAEQGLEALDEGYAPDLVILDMSMPGIGGVGFIEKVQLPDGTLKCPVLVLTARASMAEYFADVAVDGFVAKPCDPQDLLMEVNRIVFLRTGAPDSGIVAAAGELQKVLMGTGDPDTATGLKEALTEAGFVVNAVARGPELVERAVLERPDVILVDAALPGLAGGAVGTMLNEMPNTGGVPIVLFGVAGHSTEASEFQKSGAAVRVAVQGSETAEIVDALKHAYKSV